MLKPLYHEHGPSAEYSKKHTKHITLAVLMYAYIFIYKNDWNNINEVIGGGQRILTRQTLYFGNTSAIREKLNYKPKEQIIHLFVPGCHLCIYSCRIWPRYMGFFRFIEGK